MIYVDTKYQIKQALKYAAIFGGIFCLVMLGAYAAKLFLEGGN